MGFDPNIVNKFYPEVGNLMIEPMKIWALPDNKKHLFSEVCASGEYFGEEKLDGFFYQFVRTPNYCYLFSRNTSTTTGLLSEKSGNVPHIVDALSCLPADTIVIGEIYVPGGTSKSVTRIMGCLPEEAIKRQESEGNIHYYLHDIIYYDGVNLINTSAEKRYKILKAIWDKHNLSQYSFLRLAEAFDTNIEKHLGEILARGGEGVVLRKKSLPYYPGKRPAWSTIKMKQMDTIDLVCIGFCDATKEYTGKELATWPYWEILKPAFYDCFEEDHCFNGWRREKLVDTNQYRLYDPKRADPFNIFQSPRDDERISIPVTKPYYLGWKTAMRVGAYNKDGKLVEVGRVSSGLTDEDKILMSNFPDKYLNKVFNFKCMSLDKKEHTLRHPVFVGPRPDKDAKDCIIEEIFE